MKFEIENDLVRQYFKCDNDYYNARNAVDNAKDRIRRENEMYFNKCKNLVIDKLGKFNHTIEFDNVSFSFDYSVKTIHPYLACTILLGQNNSRIFAACQPWTLDDVREFAGGLERMLKAYGSEQTK